MISRTILATLAAIATAFAAPLSAGAGEASQDEQIRNLDIMLMVTSLRCRMGPDDFQSAYRSFSAAHLTALNASARRLEQGLVARFGAKGAKRALDRISVSMANEYGQGHPWLSCAQLRQVTGDLAQSRDPQALTLAANELLGAVPRNGSRWARR